MEKFNSLFSDDVAKVSIMLGAGERRRIHPQPLLYVCTFLLHLRFPHHVLLLWFFSEPLVHLGVPQIQSVRLHLLLHQVRLGLGGAALDVLQPGGFRTSRKVWKAQKRLVSFGPALSVRA